MIDKKVSDKVVWEEGTAFDKDSTSTGTQSQSEIRPQPALQSMTQPQMMFCYKCNNVIPADSKYCPCCQILLYTTCPLCGAKYSSQYPSCNQCGTNRQEYLLLQMKERERIERQARKERIRREKLEEERKEKEQQAAHQREIEDDLRRQRREAHQRLRKLITTTKEYLVIEKSLLSYRRKNIIIGCFFLIWFVLVTVYASTHKGEDLNLFTEIFIMAVSPFAMSTGIIYTIMSMSSVSTKYVLRYISKRKDYDKEIVDYVVNIISNTAAPVYELLNSLPEWCVEANERKNA